jgi:A/G-specific adenine glycosylase
MELGATLCLPRNPTCELCPVSHLCLAHQRGTQYERPVRNPGQRTPHYDVVAGVIWHATDPNRFLISQRPEAGMLGGLWEFPGGKQQDGESYEQALQRELMEELAVEVEVGPHIVSLGHAYTHFRITLHAFHARHIGGKPQCLGVENWRWVSFNELNEYAFAKTDRKIIETLSNR